MPEIVPRYQESIFKRGRGWAQYKIVPSRLGLDNWKEDGYSLKEHLQKGMFDIQKKVVFWPFWWTHKEGVIGFENAQRKVFDLMG